MDAALIVLDGWGLGDHDRRDAIRAAATPTFDRLRGAGAFGTLMAWGRSVGLPEGGLGNSEVGHLTIGAGRIVEQAHTRINRAIEAGTFREQPAIEEALSAATSADGRVHLIGLASDAGVHADLAHLEALIGVAADRDVPAVTHAITDGRDTAPQVAGEYLERLGDTITAAGTGSVATVTGRYFAMDRDENWERTRRAFEAMVDATAAVSAPTPEAAIRRAYDRDETDEFIQPTVIGDRAPIEDGDAVITTNFRADRMRQLVRLLGSVEPEWPFQTTSPAITLVTMTEYDESFPFPVVFDPLEPGHTLGPVLADAGRTQLRIAETEKYAHVTYFLNGGREGAFAGEHREIVPSPDVPTYDETPGMSAVEVTDRAIQRIRTHDPDVLVLNYANPDMVGHTGDYEAAIEAVEVVDRELGRLLDLLREKEAHVLVLADHGNADDMGTADSPHTAHTYNPVPFVYRSPSGDDGGYRVRRDGGLSDVAPTLLALLGIEPPDEMTGRSLLE